MKVKDILAEAQRLRSEHAPRERRYDDFEKAYGGGLLQDRQRYGTFPRTPLDAIPDHIAMEGEEGEEVVVNRCRSMVEATRAYIGQVPMLYAPPRDGSDEAMRTAERLERVGYGLWDVWNMARRMSDMGFYCSLLGTAVGVVWPDVKKKMPRFLIRSPRGFYPVAKDEDGYDLAYCIFYSEHEGRKAAKMFDRKSLAESDKVTVIQYIDDETVITMADDVQVNRINHKLGFVPVVCIPNIGIPGSPFGESTITLAVTLSKYLNYLTTLFFAAAREQFVQPIVLPNASQWPDGLPNGPRDVIELPEGATGQQAYRLPPPQLPFDVFKIRETLAEEISIVTDIPQLMMGGKSERYLSGQSVTAQLGPVQAMLNVRMETIFPALKRIMWMAFKMMEVMWPNVEHTVYGMQKIYGRNEKAQFTETFKVEEFGGWYEFNIVLDTGEYFDEQARWVQVLQAVQNQLLSKETAMQLNPFIKPGTLEMEKKRIAREVEENVRQNIAAQQMAESLTTQNAPMNEPTKTAFSLEHGWLGEVPPAPMPGGAEVNPPQEGQPEAIDPLVQQAVDLLRSVKNLKGRVFLMGGILQGGEYPEGTQPEMVIGLTDMLDKQTIINAVKKVVPEMYGAMKFVKVEGEPDEPYIEITGEGYEIRNPAAEEEAGLPEQGPALPEAGGEIPEEMMGAVLGGG